MACSNESHRQVVRRVGSEKSRPAQQVEAQIGEEEAAGGDPADGLQHLQGTLNEVHGWRWRGQRRTWLEAWSDVLRILDKAGMKSIEEFDERFGGTQSLFNWIQDLESELWNAGLEDRQFLTARIALCEEDCGDFQRVSVSPSLVPAFNDL